MMDTYEVSKEIIIKLIENSLITPNEFPGKQPVEMVCEAYKKVFQTVCKPNN